ncbi:kinesin-like protein klpa [Diplodia corticola]|uniref:Kinesin-like protein klpa n=1 Tax=Diplodia corticola TaxID=236234 RepID=A0A1J9S6J6_9PEZI|nr:kinesin-like protein klpa [Diplodia corticola]OJD36143.1 kinesin-like protein klpa [Diplodia corticola]
MDSRENSRPTGIKPPSKLPALSTAGRGLSELSAADNNSRAMPSTLVPTKHKVTGLPEPAHKLPRKTLAEKAGETKSKVPAPPSSKPVNGIVKATTAAGIRNGPYSSSVSAASTRPTRANSNTTYSNSYSQPPRTVRPQTSMAHTRSQSHQTPAARPRTAVESDDSDPPSLSKRKGTAPISITACVPAEEVRPRRVRGSSSTQSENFSCRKRSRATQVTPHAATEFLSQPEQHFQFQPYVQPPQPEQAGRRKSARDVSLSTRFQSLTLTDGIKECIPEDEEPPATPSLIPRPVLAQLQPLPPPPPPATPTQFRYRAASPSKEPVTPFLSKDSNTRAPFVAWDTKGRLEDMEALYTELRHQMQSTTTERENMKENVESYKTKSMSATLAQISYSLQELVIARYITQPKILKLTIALATAVHELDAMRVQLSTKVDSYRSDLENTRLKLTQSEVALDAAKRAHAFELKDLQRQSEHELKDMQFQHERESMRLKQDAERKADELQRKLEAQASDLKREYEQKHADLKKELEAELEKERQLRVKEVSELKTETELHRQNAGVDLERRDREMRELKRENEQLQADLERKTTLEKNLRDKLSEASTNTLTLESANSAMKAKINFLESDSQAQSSAFGELQKQMQEAIDAAEEAKSKLRAEETLRRKLHNQVQELKGNIRVFCRVRPPAETEAPQAAEIAYPDAGKDSKEVVIQGPQQKSAMGTVTQSTNPFTFDRVFGPGSQNAEVFEEISQLVQSALDGYNVCIFCYGQTGSGKTFTMSSVDGMIPRAVKQIYETAQGLEEKGWKYKMEGQFVEVYNENLNDLLGKTEELDKKKLEIRHDPAKKQTTITDVTTVALDSPDRVQEMLSSASRNRSVAATMANSRSSRSHSVFILKLKGENSITGERSEGTLNLVDLAGSERLSHSGATGDRLKETQNINRSLSCLGDVIGALGSGKEGAHVPYRNSKLTYLLQYSLGGNSKTLMFVMISPLQPHLHETITSLKFATKVHNTHIGTAKRQAKIKE